ncbi:hypothetical protein Cpir12675_003332 [Ceratocystis pirilliformis]|uniref:Uncharacterized protein n=1 Tax=Ceratocystis pirilliformis TaxID=259994 RepID=A0ABR3Z3D5_9PEZI
MARYNIAASNEYLAIMGMEMHSFLDYAMDLQAMTKEKLQFLLPVVFTVGPWVPQSHFGNDLPANEELEGSMVPARSQEYATAALYKHAVLLAENSAKHLNNAIAVEKKIK